MLSVSRLASRSSTMRKNSPPLLDGIPIGLMRLFMDREIADYLGIPDSSLEQHLARVVVEFAKFVAPISKLADRFASAKALGLFDELSDRIDERGRSVQHEDA